MNGGSLVELSTSSAVFAWWLMFSQSVILTASGIPSRFGRERNENCCFPRKSESPQLSYHSNPSEYSNLRPATSLTNSSRRPLESGSIVMRGLRLRQRLSWPDFGSLSRKKLTAQKSPSPLRRGV